MKVKRAGDRKKNRQIEGGLEMRKEKWKLERKKEEEGEEGI